MRARPSIKERLSAGFRCYSVNLVIKCQRFACIGPCCYAGDNVTGKAPIGGQSMTNQPLSYFSCLSLMKDDNKNVNICSDGKVYLRHCAFWGL